MRDLWGIHDNIGDGKPSGCGFYRITLPFDELNRNGWTAAYGAGRPPHDAGRILVAQRMDKHAALPEWRRFRARHRLVYEIDDDVFNVTVENWMAYGVYSKPDVRDAVEHGAQVADVVTVTTEPLAEVMCEFNPDVRVIPNVVPDGVLTMQRRKYKRDQGKVTIGWQGGASHARDMALIAAPVRHVLDRNKRAELHIIGNDFRETIGRPARFTNWKQVDASLDYYRLIDFDIGLAPLTGTRFDASKSAIKAIEYAALGIPVLASDVEAYRGFVVDGVNGYLIRKKTDWAKRLAELVNDGEARAEMGRKAREMAAGHTISSGWKKWAAVYEGLA